jgi:hypothetical protein
MSAEPVASQMPRRTLVANQENEAGNRAAKRQAVFDHDATIVALQSAVLSRELTLSTASEFARNGQGLQPGMPKELPEQLIAAAQSESSDYSAACVLLLATLAAQPGIVVRLLEALPLLVELHGKTTDDERGAAFPYLVHRALTYPRLFPCTAYPFPLRRVRSPPRPLPQAYP